MVVITVLDIVSNVIQYLFGVRTVFHLEKSSKLSSPTSIAKAILKINSVKRYVYIDNRSATNYNEEEEMENYEMQVIIHSLPSLMDNSELLNKSEIDNSLAQTLLHHLTRLQRDNGCVLVEQPKLCISSDKFNVSNYVNYS